MKERNNCYFGVATLDANYPVRRLKERPKVDGKRRRKVGWECPFYRCWYNMVRRCYDKKFQENQPNYSGVTVCEEWLVFSKFRFWMVNQDWEGNALDKDILGDGSMYNPNSCCFVSQRVNNLLLDSRKSRGKYPLGVTFQKGRYIARVNDCGKTPVNLGSFGCPTAAHFAYRKGKLEVVQRACGSVKDTRVVNKLLERFSFGN